MSCREVNESLAGFAGGKLGPRETAEVEAHLSSCSACARELDLVRRTLSLAGQVAQPQVSLAGDLFDRIRVQVAPAAPPVARPALRRRKVRGLNLKTITAGAIIFALFTGLFLFLPHAPEQAAGIPGRALWLDGTVRAQPPDGVSAPLEPGSRLATGTHLKTGPRSWARVRLGHRAEVGIYPDAEVVLHPTAPRLLKGRCFFRVGKGRTPFRVLTPSGTVEVTGTAFHVALVNGWLEASVVEGTVHLVSDGTTLVLGAGSNGAVLEGRTGGSHFYGVGVPTRDGIPHFMAPEPLLLTAAPSPDRPAPTGPAFSLDRPFTLTVTNVSSSAQTIPPFHPAYPRFMLEVIPRGPVGREAFTLNLNPFRTGPGSGEAGQVRLMPGQAYRVSFHLRGAVQQGLLKGGHPYAARAVYQAARRGSATWTGRIKSTSFSFTPGD